MRREEPVGARLREPGMEGRPRAAKLKDSRLCRSPRYGIECGQTLPEFRWYHGVIPP